MKVVVTWWGEEAGELEVEVEMEVAAESVEVMERLLGWGESISQSPKCEDTRR